MTIPDLKEFILIINALTVLITTLAVAISTWQIIKWRMARVEQVLFGNGKPGVLREIEIIKITCAKHHGDNEKHYTGNTS